jgi:thymidylate synthase (FAD)
MRMRETDGYKVKDFIPVEYLDHMGDDDAVCDAARVSFNKSSDNYSSFANGRLLSYLAEHEHWSPFAHVSLKLRFRAPLFIARQFQKHTVGFAWNEVSRRYVSKDITFFIPDTWRKRPDNMKQGSVSEGEVPLDESLLRSYVNKMREHGKDYKELTSSSICPEQARMIMPQSMMTEWIWTGSLYAWIRFIQLRSDAHAQAECWPYAASVADFLHDYFPQSMEAFTNE